MMRFYVGFGLVGPRAPKTTMSFIGPSGGYLTREAAVEGAEAAIYLLKHTIAQSIAPDISTKDFWERKPHIAKDGVWVWRATKEALGIPGPALELQVLIRLYDDLRESAEGETISLWVS